MTDPHIDQRIETTRRNLSDAKRAGDQQWITAEEAILRSLLKIKAAQESDQR